ncbi:replicative DNA helicase [Burkholderia vietnamiensis]|uniref:replicative DNA helicase n=1 Tax=Burkholderia vietnamiensis TaxID=60552 RepID=UPI001D157D2D|nr:replicative DNA helicase [Burkholderia vietnamiensis]UEC05600.1 replicative DNA helicase [Burkholderia vietnamiensis]
METTKSDTPELHAREAEQCLVAALFSEQGSEIFNQLALSALSPDDFYVPAYRLAYVAAGELSARGEYPDRSTLAGYIKSNPAFGPEMQAEIAEAVAAPWSSRNVGNYIDAVIEKSRARQISGSLSGLLDRTRQIGGDVRSDDLVRELDAVSLGLGERSTTNGLLRVTDDHLRAVVSGLEARQNGEAEGVRTGIGALDERLGGMQGGELIIVAARPAMGKSAFGLEIALYNAAKSVPGIGLNPHGPEPDPADVPMVAVFSMEMPEEQLTQRMLANFAHVPFQHLRKATLTDEDWARLADAFPRYGRADVRIDAASRLTPAMLRAKVRVLERHTKKKVRLVLIDYLQLMEGDERHQNRASELAEITRKLKLLAKELDAPIIALSQLNRDLEKRTDKRPMMADLRESGSIEQDSDTIIFLYRDEYYNPDSPAKGMAEILIGKARNSVTGMVPAQFSGEYQQFSSMPMGEYSYESSYGA